YAVKLDGNVSAYLNPGLAFGHGSSYGSLPWIFAAVFGFAAVDLVIVRVWAARTRRRAFAAPAWSGVDEVPAPIRAVPPTPASCAPGAQGIRIEQLNSLASLRDSGALTEDEYEAEKKRVLDEL
ncbi:MAG: SHOCT domain-containing protein, partial [Actinomycetota bacterium]|nr:SHOCT domain-containing protein [Actinomycetota bacterium]